MAHENNSPGHSLKDGLSVEDGIIAEAYAEKVREAFRVFADNIAVGQSEKSCKERFLRSMQIAQRARTLAMEALSGVSVVEPTEFSDEAGDGPLARQQQTALSAEDQAMIDQALAGTTGQAAPKLIRR